MLDNIPEEVKCWLAALSEDDCEAYIVGGALRDMLQGRQPHDFDVAVAAEPDRIRAIAAQHGWSSYDLGSRFGVVAVHIGRMMIETTTLRGESYGQDAHRPEQIWFTTDIAEDLARRDFTINAMALSVTGSLIDPFGGQRDIVAKIVRTVGEPATRFGEDALRMFRACRFIAQLGFVIAEDTYEAFSTNLARVAGLSVERVTAELDKMLVAPYASKGLELLAASGLLAMDCSAVCCGQHKAIAILPELQHLVGLEQNTQYHRLDAWRHTLAVVEQIAPTPVLRWAALLHDVGKGLSGIRTMNKDGQPADYGHENVSAALAVDILTRLRKPPALCHRVAWLIRNHMRFGFHLLQPETVLLRWLRQEAQSRYFRSNAQMQEAFQQLSELGYCDCYAARSEPLDLQRTACYGRRLVQAARQMPVSTSELLVDCRYWRDRFGSGRMLGLFLHNVLSRVQAGDLENTPEVLNLAANKWYVRHIKAQGKR